MNLFFNQDWFLHSIVAAFSIGAMMAMYKVPAVKGHNKNLYSFLSFSICSLIAFFVLRTSIHIDQTTLTVAFFWGVSYSTLVLLQMTSLKRVETSTLLPFTSLSSHVLVILLGIFFYKDHISILQLIGIVSAFILVIFFADIKRHLNIKNGIPLSILGIVLFSTLGKFLQKLGSISVEINNFIFWQLFFAAASSFFVLFFLKYKNRELSLNVSKNLFFYSFLLGIFNFVGTYEIVKALSTGPFSLVYTINTFYILITALIAWKFFGETLNKRKVYLLLGAVLILVIIKIG
jgi:uncharacterized membrane protein